MYKKLFKIHRVFELALFSFILIGCATASKDVSPTYISHALYQSYDCNQLMNEAQRIHARIDKLGGILDDAARNDILIGAAGAILFWPALIAIGGMKGEQADYGLLKGKASAVQQGLLEKKCTIPFSPSTANSSTTGSTAHSVKKSDDLESVKAESLD